MIKMDLLNDTSSFTDYCRNAVDIATMNNVEADFIYFTNAWLHWFL